MKVYALGFRTPKDQKQKLLSQDVARIRDLNPKTLNPKTLNPQTLNP